jgi:archaellum biogenesis ATPase FlaH
MSNLTLSGTTTQTEPKGPFLFNKTSRPQKIKIIELPTFKTLPINKAFAEAKDTITNQKNIFGDLITEGDLTILFGRSNVGKSFLSYQIGEAISTGKNVLKVMDNLNIKNYGETNYYNLNNETPPQKILYVDFEATIERDFLRYCPKDQKKTGAMPYVFSQNFITSFPERLTVDDNLLFIDSIELEVKKQGVKVLIIDNMSAISQDNEKSGQAVKLMNKIKDMQRRNKLTLLLMAHTPKILPGEPIISNNLAGSSNLFNLADAVMAINTSTMSDDIRYIKQLKSRYNEIQFHRENVIAIKFSTRPDGMKGFEFSSYETEEDLLKPQDKATREEEDREILNLINNFGYSIMQIAEKLQPTYAPDVDVHTYYERIKKRVQRYKANGKINDNTDAPLKPIAEVLLSSPSEYKIESVVASETNPAEVAGSINKIRCNQNDSTEEMFKKFGIKSHIEREKEEMEQAWLELQKDFPSFKETPTNNFDKYNDIPL